jgi:hypothetical protein
MTPVGFETTISVGERPQGNELENESKADFREKPTIEEVQ